MPAPSVDPSSIRATSAPRPARLRVAVAVAAIGLVGIALLAGCTASVPPKAEMVSALRTSGMPAKEARCVADAIYAKLSTEQIQQLIERGNGGTPKNDPNSSDDTADELTRAMAACQAAAVPTEPPGEPVGGPIDGGSDTTTTSLVTPSTTGGAVFTTTTTTSPTGTADGTGRTSGP